jgi:hypothetical protein
MFVIFFYIVSPKILLLNLDSGSQYYQQPANQALNPTNFVQALNAQDNVSPPIALPTNLTTYQVKY